MKLVFLILELLPFLAFANKQDTTELVTQQNIIDEKIVQDPDNLRKPPSLERKLKSLGIYDGSGKGKGGPVMVTDDCYDFQQGYDMGKGKGYALCPDPTAEPTFEPTYGGRKNRRKRRRFKNGDLDDRAVTRWVGNG